MARASKQASGRTGGGPSGDSERTAHSHKRTREAHLREKAQDYVEAIADLLSARGEARVVDLARLLGVTHVTVVQSVARLKRAGLVRSEPYRSIFLTPEGEALAAEAKRRHEVVLAFLLALGVPRAVAESDAEGIEHHVSPATLTGLVRATAILGRG
ncbi:MAG: manganese-binding transcriptional regulator MntR [Phycisphaerae bacterium]|nr:manganese-binding transcriptional regulator MntR [Phycisphaerae bacterium]